MGYIDYLRVAVIVTSSGFRNEEEEEERQTDRQTDRHTDTQIHRQRQRNRQTEKNLEEEEVVVNRFECSQLDFFIFYFFK